MTDKTISAMLVNIGGASAPAIHILNEHKPPYICFFVSEDSKKMIREKILPDLEYTPTHYDWIQTDSPQNLMTCYKALTDDLPRILKKWNVAPENLGVEYTAGTKPMSVAAVLATLDTCSNYFYVGAADSSGRKDGYGVVLDGKEFTWFQVNPWEVLAVEARKEVSILFNHGRYADARERTERLAQVSEPEMKPVYEKLAELIEGYALWDRFEYTEAQEKMSRALKVLKPYLTGKNDPLHTMLEEVDRNLEFLRAINPKTPQGARLDFLDLLANARRRAEKAKKFDDAVARLYSALEAAARSRLLHIYGIKNGALPIKKIPEHLLAEFLKRYGDPDKPDAPIKIGLKESYRLLEALGDDLGKAYSANQSDLEKVLNIRNSSRLAHGTAPVREETYQKMLDLLYLFGNVTPEELPEFPELRL
jgi:CRISPR-associated protein (TIGR02710 family)